MITAVNADIEPEAEHTAELLYFFDQLFDSVNERSVRPKKLKILRAAVTRHSKHIQFWNKAIEVLESMRYVDKQGRETRSPSLRNWVRTLKNFKHLWFELQKQGFRFLCPRNLNQDPVENKFGSIRSYGITNFSPNCTSFIAAYKSLILNDLTASHSVGGNCEKDECALLDNLQKLIKINSLKTEVSKQSTSSTPAVKFQYIQRRKNVMAR
jgi:hypothetical protein